MVATYTDNARLTKQGSDDNPNTWGRVLNQQVIDLIEEMTVGVEEVDVTGTSNVTLTTSNGVSDQARNKTLELTGTLGADIELLVPSVNWAYNVRCAWTGNFTVTMKISGSATSVVLSTGDKKIVYTNGTDIFDMVDVDLSSFLVNSNNLSDVSSASTARTNIGLGDIAVEDKADVQNEFLEAAYPVGSIYLNASSATNPGTLLGFGTWEAFAEGRVLVGVGTGTDENAVDKTVTAGQEYGEYEHVQTEAELAAHTHSYTRASTTSTTSTGYCVCGSSSRWATSTTNTSNTTGSSTAMDWSQPSIGVYMWKRTA